MTAAGDMLVDWSGYADDLMLFFEDEKSLRLGLTSTGNRYIRIGISVSQCTVDLSAVMMLHFNGQLIF